MAGQMRQLPRSTMSFPRNTTTRAAWYVLRTRPKGWSFASAAVIALALLAGGCADKNTSGASSNAPTLVSISPSTATVGATIPVVLTGTNFVSGSTTVAISGTGVTASNVVVTSPTSLSATLTLAATASTGARTATVTNGAGTSGEQSFTVAAAPRPTVTAVSPASAGVGT